MRPQDSGRAPRETCGDDTAGREGPARNPRRWRAADFLRYTVGEIPLYDLDNKQHDPASTIVLPGNSIGRLLALDPGTRRVGAAVSDELRITVRTLPYLPRTNWKKLVSDVAELCNRYDAKGVVVGLPLNLDGSEGPAASEARRMAHNLSLTLGLPVYLQDERLTSHTASEMLRAEQKTNAEVGERVDSESAAIILNDFLLGNNAGKETQEAN